MLRQDGEWMDRVHILLIVIRDVAEGEVCFRFFFADQLVENHIYNVPLIPPVS